VFALTLGEAEAARKRLTKRHKVTDVETGMKHLLSMAEGRELPRWSFQGLRRTCATVLANMPTVGPWIESKALGHSVQVAESLYAGRMRIEPDAKTIEDALGIGPELLAITRSLFGTSDASGPAR
jgi:hypothetical protein